MCIIGLHPGSLRDQDSQMDDFTEGFVNGVLAELNHIPDDAQISHIKNRVGELPAEDAKKLAQMYIMTVRKGSYRVSKSIVIVIYSSCRQVHWQDSIRGKLAQYPYTQTYLIGYDFSDVLRFLCPVFTRKQPIKRILRDLRDIINNHKNDSVCVLAYGFGSYIIGTILKNYPDVQIGRLILCSSVIKGGYRWDSLKAFPSGGVVNDCGKKDFWPVLAKCVSWGYGSSGIFGFKSHKVHNRFHNLRCGDFFQNEFMDKFWIPFILRNKVEFPAGLAIALKPPIWVRLLNFAPTKLIIFILVVYFVAPYFFTISLPDNLAKYFDYGKRLQEAPASNAATTQGGCSPSLSGVTINGELKLDCGNK